MIVLSVGLPKSGSAWFYFMTNELLKAAGHDDALDVRQRYRLEDMLKFKTCNIQEPTNEKLALLSSPPISEHTFAVKTHFPPNAHLLDYMEQGLIKTSIIYRDPRDMAVSAFEAGEKQRAQGKSVNFATLTTMTKAIHGVETWLKRIWEPWHRVAGIFMVPYEDLLDATKCPVELIRFCDFLGIQLEERTITDISHRWRGPQVQTPGTPQMHFNKGRAGRFREVMTPGELALCEKILTPYLAEMGYNKP